MPGPKGPDRSRRRGNRVEGAKRARGGWGLLQERQPLTHNCLGKRAGVLDLVVGLQIRAELTQRTLMPAQRFGATSRVGLFLQIGLNRLSERIVLGALRAMVRGK
jgi:hypothetical protein